MRLSTGTNVALLTSALAVGVTLAFAVSCSGSNFAGQAAQKAGGTSTSTSKSAGGKGAPGGTTAGGATAGGATAGGATAGGATPGGSTAGGATAGGATAGATAGGGLGTSAPSVDSSKAGGTGTDAGIATDGTQTLVQRTIKFDSGQDTACNMNCIAISVNGSAYQQLGCNKTAPQHGDCNSPGGLHSELSVGVVLGKCNSLKIKLQTTTQDGGPFDVLDSTNPALQANKNYQINSRTPQAINLWINDNNDDDVHDFLATITALADLSIGIDNFAGAACP